MDEFPTTWQVVGSENNDLTTLRLRVPGGWLVHIRDSSNNQSQSNFVSDPQHIWTLEV